MLVSFGDVVGATAAVDAGVVNTTHWLGFGALEGTKVLGDTVFSGSKRVVKGTETVGKSIK